MAAAQPFLTRKPEGVVFADWLDSAHQRELCDRLPDNLELVVGVGGGRALDVSKFVALVKGVPLVLVPTIVSSGAIIHGFVANWEGRELIGGVDDWPWVDCEYIVVDFDLALVAPYYLNTAGLGDILCGYAALAEWEWRASRGFGPPFDRAAAAAEESYYDELVKRFSETLDRQARLTADSVRHIMVSLRDRDSRKPPGPTGVSGDHNFWLALELVNDRAWIHGEMVALGAAAIAWNAEASPDSLIARLDACKVRFRPSEMGLSRDQLQKGLEFVPSYLTKVASDSVLRHRPITGKRFDALWAYLENT
jgi:glycerol-1-phosphate dehydrogenase [NAD(P)+]